MASIEMPMALLLFLTFIVGVVVGWVITLMRAKSSKSKARDDSEA